MCLPSNEAGKIPFVTATLGFPAIFEHICFWLAILRNHKDPSKPFKKECLIYDNGYHFKLV